MKIPYFDSRDLDYNPLINSNFDFWQRSISTPLTTVEAKVSDKHHSGTVGPTAKSVTIARSTDVPTAVPIPARYSSQLTNNTSVPSFAVNDYLYPLWHPIEGTIWRPVAGDKFTLGFWLFTSVAGTYTVAIRRNTGARYYVTTVTSPASVWTYHVVHIPLDTGGPAQAIDESRALDVVIGAVGGTNSQAPSLNVWANGVLFTHASATNWAATVGAVIRIAQMGIKKGFRSLEDMRDGYKPHGQNYAEELRACQRYYEKSYLLNVFPGTVTSEGAWVNLKLIGTSGGSSLTFKTMKRAAPVVTLYSSNSASPNLIRDLAAGVDRAAAVSGEHEWGVRDLGSNATPNGNGQAFQWTADADF